MDEIKIWEIDGETASPVQPAVGIDSEERLEEILVKNPDMLIPDLMLVGRQTSTEGGPLDLLGVDGDGRLVLFELKRGRLSRDAVAQIIDYASYLESMGVNELTKHIAEQSGTGGIDKIENFEDWHAENFGEDSLNTLLPMQMFMVGLGVDDRTERMVRFLAGKRVDISLLTFQGFTQDGKTLLARQMRVEAEDEPVSNPPKKGLSTSEKSERLQDLVKENGVIDLFESVRAMFRENWSNSREKINANSVGLRLPKRDSSGGSSTRPCARLETRAGSVVIVFYSHSVEPCREQFKPYLEPGKLRYETWRKDSRNNPVKDPLEDPQPEIKVLVNADEWATHEDGLSELAREVYGRISG